MAKYHFYISYSAKDGKDMARKLTAALREKGYSVWLDLDSMEVTANFSSVIADVISDCECFLPIITDGFFGSKWAQAEMDLAIARSEERAKIIIPLICTGNPMPAAMQMWLGRYLWIRVPDPEDMSIPAARIDQMVGAKFRGDMLYERLAEYRSLKHPVKVTETLCQLLELRSNQWQQATPGERRMLCLEICRLLEQMSGYPGEYNAEAKAVGRRILDTLRKIGDALMPEDSDRDIFMEDLFFIAFAVRWKYWYRELRSEAIDLITGGDVFCGAINPCPLEEAIAGQSPYVEAFKKAVAWEQNTLAMLLPEEKEFVEQTPRFIMSRNRAYVAAERPAVAAAEPASEEDAVLLSVAKFMQEGNRLFDVLQQRGIAGDFLKCLLTSYERLKNYCQIVGATEVAADCVDRILEIRGLLDKEEGTSGDNEKAENGIKSLLGFTLNTGSNYDVFISFKSEDTDLAEKVYKLCQKHMKVPFWSKRSLPELSESEYEKAIYQALDRSTHFVVVLSDLGYMEADWIQEEMRVFHREKNEGRKPENANFVFVVTDELYTRIIRNNKRDIPIEYRGYQIIKMSEYESTLPQYFN